ncbi:MAG: hypothetical protein F4139_01510 [Gemmatimonadetes bacterium]|nr:hypothetical protein [Gemmatimonadota bacterium]MYK67249.1 hypothetical protein [Gemmatimonadota bacterium]
MNRGMWSVSSALVLGLAACQGPGPAGPMPAEDSADPWAGTSWAALFEEVKELGNRGVLVVVDETRSFAVAPPAGPALWVHAEPTCGVSDAPGPGEVGSYLKCLEDRVLGDPTRMMSDELRALFGGRGDRPDYVITREPDDSMWYVWTIPKWWCANGWWEAEKNGTIVQK